MLSAILLILKPGSSELCKVKYPKKLLSSWLGSYQAAAGVTRGQLKGKINVNQDLHQNISMQLAPRAGALLQSWVLQGGFSSAPLEGKGGKKPQNCRDVRNLCLDVIISWE